MRLRRQRQGQSHYVAETYDRYPWYSLSNRADTMLHAELNREIPQLFPHGPMSLASCRVQIGRLDFDLWASKPNRGVH